ncbi:MAG: type II secretion system GspH family protein [Clostridiales Family XIII bacterium]|jgi:prepilin-type N-terminal cleavage/methylation domain-containing protein|nr:type II secretion system GspH family protein [Clostridiales Family XIII bacterium]
MNKSIHGKKKQGFTLIEIIVVLVILAILAAIAVPPLIGYIEKSEKTQIKHDAHVAVEALQAWAVAKYAEGIKGAYLQDGAELTPYQPEVKAGQPSTEVTTKYNVGIDFWNTSQGTRISIFNAGAGTPGMSALVFWDGEFKETTTLPSGTDTGKNVTVAPYTPEGPGLGNHTVGVVLVKTTQVSALSSMSYTELKSLGLVKEGSLNNANNSNTSPGQQSGPSTGFIKNAAAMNYDPGAAHPAVDATYIWKQIVDSYAKNGIADDDNVILDYVCFDDRNKVVEMEYTLIKGDKTFTCYFDGWDGDKYNVN